MDIISTCIPQQTLKRRRNVPWLTKNIIRHMRKRNAAFHATKRSDRPEIATKYKKLRNKVVKMPREAKNSYLNRLNIGSKKQFWKAVKVLRKQQSTIPTLHHQEATAETNYEKATMLNEYFSSCFNASVPPLSKLDVENQTHIEPGSTCPEDLLCTTEEVLSYIQALDATKASDPDGNPLECSNILQQALLHPLQSFSIFPSNSGAFQLVGKLLLLYLYQSHLNTMRSPTTDQYPFYR